MQPCGVDVISVSLHEVVQAQPRLCRTAGFGIVGLFTRSLEADFEADLYEGKTSVLLEDQKHSWLPYRAPFDAVAYA